jgi:hypothetical protein
MIAWPALLLLIASAAPPVEVATLNGDQHVGTLERMTTDEIVIKTPSGSTQVPASELLAIRLPGPMPTTAAESPIEVSIIDGSLLRVTSYATTASHAELKHALLGEIKVPLSVIQSVRFAAADPKVDAAWKQLQGRPSRKDQVAVRKNDVLDHLDGVIGTIDQATVKFQLDGEEIPVKRERVFGMIYAKREATSGKASSALDLASGDRLTARAVAWDGEVWKVKLAAGTELSIPSTGVQLIDYTQGKIAYLSNLEPRDVQYTPYYESGFVWEYRRDRGLDRYPIRFGSKVYAKGLSVHSATNLKYRIGGDYRRFQTIVGIDERYRGNVDIVIKGDGRTLFKGAARIDQPPQSLDLDVTGVVELEINIGYGEDGLDIGDWLHLADAKVIK